MPLIKILVIRAMGKIKGIPNKIRATDYKIRGLVKLKVSMEIRLNITTIKIRIKTIIRNTAISPKTMRVKIKVMDKPQAQLIKD